MAFTGKISPGSRAYVLFAMKCKRLRKKDINEQVNISRASLYRILKQKKDAKRKKARASEDTVFGRPRKLGPREERMLLRKIHPLRKAEGQFTVKRLIREAGINSTNVSCRTIQRFLCSKGYKYLHARQKGLLTEQDIVKRLKFAREMKREHTEDFWTKEIAFYLDGVSFVHKYNPADQARAPKGRIWRKDDEGLAFGCSAKGSHCGTWGRVAKFMVAITYREGVILCEQQVSYSKKRTANQILNALLSVNHIFESLNSAVSRVTL